MMWMTKKEQDKLWDLKTKQIICDLPRNDGMMLEMSGGQMRGVEWATVTVTIQNVDGSKAAFEEAAGVLASVLPLSILERAAELGREIEAKGGAPLAAFRPGWEETLHEPLPDSDGVEVHVGKL